MKHHNLEPLVSVLEENIWTFVMKLENTSRRQSMDSTGETVRVYG